MCLPWGEKKKKVITRTKLSTHRRPSRCWHGPRSGSEIWSDPALLPGRRRGRGLVVGWKGLTIVLAQCRYGCWAGWGSSTGNAGSMARASRPSRADRPRLSRPVPSPRFPGRARGPRVAWRALPRRGSATCLRSSKVRRPRLGRSRLAAARRSAATSSSFLPNSRVDVEDAVRFVEDAESAGASGAATSLYRRPPQPRTSPGGHSCRPSAACGSNGDVMTCEPRCCAPRPARKGLTGAPLSTTPSATQRKPLALDPYRETSYVQLLRLHEPGEPGQALRAYEQCRAVLADDLGVTPSSQTEAVYREVLGPRPNTGHPPDAPGTRLEYRGRPDRHAPSGRGVG